MSKHKVKLTDSEKVSWFKTMIQERQKTSRFESESDVIEFVRFLRGAFRKVHGRDVPGSFISRLLSDLGIAREFSARVKEKREFMFDLMNKNASYRDNKTQLRKIVEAHYGERILGIVFDEIWDEYHQETNHPKPVVDIDIHGQVSLFGDNG